MRDVKFLRLNRRGLVVTGLWVGIKSKSPFKQKLYSMYGLIMIIIYAIFNSMQFIEMFRVMNNLKLLMENIGITLLIFIGFTKLANIRFRWNRIKNIITKMEKEQEIIFEEGGDSVDIYQKGINYNETLIRIWGVLVFSNIFMCFGSRVWQYLITGPQEIYRSKVPLMFSSWYPYDKYTHGNYEIIYGLQLFSGTMAAYIGAYCDTLNVSFILFGINQFYQLKHKIRNLHIVRAANNTLLTEQIQIVDPYNDVIRIIKLHNRTIEFFKDISDYMSPILFLQFLIYSFIICTFGLDIMMSNEPIHIIFGIQVTSSLLVELFFYYWYANEATLESLNVGKVVGESEWYRLSSRAKKALLIMMMRADRPIEISVGGVHTMCLESYVALMKSAYSFLALFRQMYGRDDN